MFGRIGRRYQSVPAPVEWFDYSGRVEQVGSAVISGTQQFFIKVRLDSGGIEELQLTAYESSDVAFVKRGDRVEFVQVFNPYRDIYNLGAPAFTITNFRIVNADAELDAS